MNYSFFFCSLLVNCARVLASTQIYLSLAYHLHGLYIQSLAPTVIFSFFLVFLDIMVSRLKFDEEFIKDGFNVLKEKVLPPLFQSNCGPLPGP